MKTAEEEAREKARRQIRLRETETWTWEEIVELIYMPVEVED
jgi:hypothetical protein